MFDKGFYLSTQFKKAGYIDDASMAASAILNIVDYFEGSISPQPDAQLTELAITKVNSKGKIESIGSLGVNKRDGRITFSIHDKDTWVDALFVAHDVVVCIREYDSEGNFCCFKDCSGTSLNEIGERCYNRESIEYAEGALGSERTNNRICDVFRNQEIYGIFPDSSSVVDLTNAAEVSSLLSKGFEKKTKS